MNCSHSMWNELRLKSKLEFRMIGNWPCNMIRSREKKGNIFRREAPCTVAGGDFRWRRFIFSFLPPFSPISTRRREKHYRFSFFSLSSFCFSYSSFYRIPRPPMAPRRRWPARSWRVATGFCVLRMSSGKETRSLEKNGGDDPPR